MNDMLHSRPATKISFFVARLEYAAVLHHYAYFAVELDFSQKPFHGSGQHLRFPDLAAELRKPGFLLLPRMRHALSLSPLEKNMHVIGEC